MVRRPKEVIIDTDPGMDDAVAILLASESPELDVIGFTTTYETVRTEMATYNAFHLVIEDNRTFRKNVGQIIVLGGAFMVNGI